MIAKRIDRDPEKVKYDNYRALSLYIGGYTEKKPEEKVLYAWSAGCAEDDFLGAIIEAEAVQCMNTKSESDKTYHLMLSFRPEDDSKLTREMLEDVERNVATALGFENHQRHVGVHKNTNNIHVHIAYNKINPITFNIHEPFRDFYSLAKICREMEQQYGLVVDRGIERGQEPVRTNVQAQTMEAHSGQESFDGYIRRNKAILLNGLEKAGNWQEAHKALAIYGIGIKPGNNGLVLYDLHGKHHAKASTLSRDTSRAALEKRFGVFEQAKSLRVRELESYSKKPLQLKANRENLYESYLAALAEKKKSWREFEELKLRNKVLTAEIKRKWLNYRLELKANYKLLPQDRWLLMQQSYLRQKEELEALAGPRKKTRQEIRKRFPFSSWADFLKDRAMAGNETALDILRSKNEVFQGQETQSPEQDEIQRQKKLFEQRKHELLENTALAMKDKKRLLAVAKLQERTFQEIKVSISPSGVLILALTSTGGSIRDTGKEIYFSGFDSAARVTAERYAKIKWGQMKVVQENSILFAPARRIGLER